jgi:5-methylcytosine-specific restriction enzyme A
MSGGRLFGKQVRLPISPQSFQPATRERFETGFRWHQYSIPMPTRALRPCSKAGCPNNHDCAIHVKAKFEFTQEAKRKFDKERQQDPQRKIYKTAAWRRVRQAVLQRDPLCTLAIKCVERFGQPIASEVVDHRVPIRSGGDAWDTNNLQGACKPCHDHKTATEDSKFARKKQ